MNSDKGHGQTGTARLGWRAGSRDVVALEYQAAKRRDGWLIALVVLFVVVAPLVTQRIYASDEIQYFAYTHSLVFDQDLVFSNEYLHFYNLDKVKFADIYTDLYNKHEPA